jgi:hypothetical protein
LAYFTELWQRLVLLDHHATCVALDRPVADIINGLRAANGGRLALYPTSSPLDPQR